jgi:hypothetical protein
MIRRGSLVTAIAALVASHPIYSVLVGQQVKVEKVIKRGDKHFAVINGVKVPAMILQGIPQKKGQAALARVRV